MHSVCVRHLQRTCYGATANFTGNWNDRDHLNGLLALVWVLFCLPMSPRSLHASPGLSPSPLQSFSNVGIWGKIAAEPRRLAASWAGKYGFSKSHPHPRSVISLVLQVATQGAFRRISPPKNWQSTYGYRGVAICQLPILF